MVGAAVDISEEPIQISTKDKSISTYNSLPAQLEKAKPLPVVVSLPWKPDEFPDCGKLVVDETWWQDAPKFRSNERNRGMDNLGGL